MSNNFEKITGPEEADPSSKEQKDRELGAKLLTRANFEARQEGIVNSSFNKARENGEKLPGKNNERRNYAYLSRLERMIEEHGNDLEKRLWQASMKDDLLIKFENIPESYWDSKRQELRDNGYGNVELSEWQKHQYYEEERKLQKESLEKWANYLGDKNSPYPLWFKVYAWDGMTKMGTYNKGKNKYEVRNETTVAPYPDPDAEVLAKVFETVNQYYGNNQKEFYTEEGERNIALEEIVKSGNFAKIFNAIQQDIAPIVEPPENPEDVHGDWVEYSLGEEDDIARAARGTGWCVASSPVGRHYLEYGEYGRSNNENNNEHIDSEAKFIFYHLRDPRTGKPSKNAVASIRLNPDGKVAEISGLKEGQALNDSLVSIVEEKVKSLPGGEEFLPKFYDKQELIRLDRKMKNNEDLTKEELEFLYEINRPIATLDTYNTRDPRISELKEKYGIEYALDAGIDVDRLASQMNVYDIVEILDILLSHGANIDVDNLVYRMYPFAVAENLDTLLSHGANIDFDDLISRLHPYDVAKNLDTLLSHGANIDINDMVSHMRPYDIAENLDTLISHGANIDVDRIARGIKPEHMDHYRDILRRHGANV